MYEITVALTLCAFVAFYIRTVIVQPMLDMNASVLHIGKMQCETQFELAENKRRIDTIRKLAMMQRFSNIGVFGQNQSASCLTCGVFFGSRTKMFEHLDSVPDHKV